MANTLIEYRGKKGERLSFDAAAVIFMRPENQEDETRGTLLWFACSGDEFHIEMPYRWVEEDVRIVREGGSQVLRDQGELEEWYRAAGFEASN